ncbi:MAG: DUF1552 domain-containing protein [Proteobacteria bacterium]|nr:DUF1552 domain-containing protein [Pseudomonadota bacterium]MBK9253176.1 DUF1552 domain-containing protein [Pseudomonadota bacterium]MCC6631925.1 DUF1552 domain-containing protein [Gammaproteobacteria bacterium]
MFITKKHISRRTLLKGAGVGLSLPLLDAMIPASTALGATAAAAKPRLGFFYFPHGAVMENWTPSSEGRDFDLKSIVEPLAPFRKQLTLVSNLGNKPGESRAVHALVPATWLSCVHPKEGLEPSMAATVDQIAASHIGQDTPWPSLEIATAQGHGVGSACERGYGCSYSGTLSFRNASTPLPVESNPRQLFLRLFGQGDSLTERRFLTQQTASLLDMISGEVASLSRSLGPQDQRTLHDYLDSVREIERRIQNSERGDLARLTLPEVPGATSQNFDEHLRMMFDLVALAWQGNLTRIQTFMIAPEVSEQTYNHIGVPDAFHAISHHANDPAKKARLAKIQRYHSEVFADFLARLAKTPDGEGSMLDNSMLLYGSNMSNSNAHNQYPLPTAIIGGGAGRLRGGQHINFAQRTPLANVHLTLLQRAGVPIERVGDSTGVIAEL